LQDELLKMAIRNLLASRKKVDVQQENAARFVSWCSKTGWLQSVASAQADLSINQLDLLGISAAAPVLSSHTQHWMYKRQKRSRQTLQGLVSLLGCDTD